jgi:hypothetical protein
MPLNKDDLGLNDRSRQGTDEQRAAYLEIEALMEQAGQLLERAKELAETHDLTFTVELPTGLSHGDDVNGYGSDGWNPSSNC